MGRNRKHGSAARFVPAVKAALLCLLLGGSAIGYVYQKNQIIDLGKQIQQREKRLTQLTHDNAKESKLLQTLQTPKSLEQKVRELKLDLLPPGRGQILTIVEVPAGITNPEPLLPESLIPEQPVRSITVVK